MKKSSIILIILILPLITSIAFFPIPQTDAWGQQTHYFIVNKAIDNISNSSWANAFNYYTEELLSGAVAPDVLWQDWENHLYYPDTGYGNAPSSAALWYDFARANFTLGQWEDGFFAAGVMTHYFADPCIPVHTDEWWVGHPAYETDINYNLDGLTIATPTESMVTNVSQLVVDSAVYSNQYYDVVRDAYPDGESEAIATNSTIKALTEDCLSMAIDGVLSLFYNLTLGIEAPDVIITYEYVAMIDFAHGNDYAPNQLTAINQTLAINGFELIEQETEITLSNLATVDLLIMTCAETTYTVDELAAITTWSQSGNKAILLTGRGDFDIYKDNNIMNQILIELGSNIRINDDNVYMEGTYNPWYNDITTIRNPSDTVNLTYDVDSVSFFSPSSLYFIDDDPILPIIYADVTAYQTNQQPPAINVIYDNVMDGEWGNQIPLAAAEEIGTTRLFVGGTTFFSDFDHGDPYFENIQLLENFLDWAMGNRSEDAIPDVDEVGPRISNIQWTPTSPVEGQNVTVTLTASDPGGVVGAALKYNNGTHNIILPMETGDGINFAATISDVENGIVDFLIEAEDTTGNIAVRAYFTIEWPAITTTTTSTSITTTTTATNTTTSTTTGTGGTIPPSPMLLFGVAIGILVVIVIIVIVTKSRHR
ncbi:hypothetical protein EU527_12095 [Candidatus Thorarchaeota archaeon]|nr:MAG: hypothetical protein EU527_12095 [Candidatus Thorarchaeota archaeon]